MSRRLATACSILALVSLPARAAHADDADALIARGIELRERGKDDDALALFRKAFATSPSPRAQAQVALAEQALGLWTQAEADLVLALGAESDAWIAKNRAALEGALAVVRRHIGSLDIRGTDGAEVLLDGVKLGVLPQAAFRVEAGRRTVEVRAAGYQATTRIVDVPAGGVARETVHLAAARPGAPAAVAKVDSAPSPPAGDGGSGQRLLGWVFVGTGGAVLAFGGAGFFVRQGIISDYNDKCPGLGAAQPADCDDKIESSRTWQTVSIVGLVAGGAFVAGGLALVLTAPTSPTRVACAPWLGGATCSGSF